MKPPPLLLSAALLLWGWQTGLWVWAVAMAALLEGARLLRLRWEFSQPDLDRVWNLCTILFLAALVYALTAGVGAQAWVSLPHQASGAARLEAANRSARLTFLLFQWLPLTTFPMALVQVCSAQPRMDLSTFSLWLRLRRRRPGAQSAGGVNIGYGYFAACLLGACAAPARSPWFVVALSGLLGWALWQARSKSYRTGSWATSLAAAMVLGLVAQAGLVYVQALVQGAENFLLNRLGPRSAFDPRESRMQVGALGRLKRSGRILWRLKTEAGPPPPRLREASYDFFKWPFWAATARDFNTVFEEDTNTHSWVLCSGLEPQRSVVMTGLLPDGKGVLPLPFGAAVLEQLPVFGLETNRLGAVRSLGGPGFLQFRVRSAQRSGLDSPPGPSDLEVPIVERPALERVVRQLGLAGRPAGEVLDRVAAWFEEHFQYSLWRPPPVIRGTNETVLSRFLLHDRKGHCEYFATATVLLLRYVGVPARYAVGYAVQERKGNDWIVRVRHGHAWCLAWVNGAWQELDTTPGSWLEVENSQATGWEAVSDLWSAAWFAFSRFRWGQTGLRAYLLWVMGAVLLIAVGRLLWSRPWRQGRARPTESRVSVVPGTDSEFYLAERHLAALGLRREDGETLAGWLKRVAHSGIAGTDSLQPALVLHYRLRFDPQGLSAAERLVLRRTVLDWLASAQASR